MRRIVAFLAAGLITGLVLQQGMARDLVASPAKGKPKPAEVCTDDSCGKYGTSVQFVESPSKAAEQAGKEEKLVLVLHVSGDFEDPDFTWNNAEALRVNALANPEVGKFINKYFVSAFQRVGTFRIVGRQKQGGNVAAYFCAPDGRVLHCVAGPVNAQQMLNESKWVIDTTMKAIKEAGKDGAKFKAIFRTAHAEKLRREHGLNVDPVTFDPPIDQDDKSALTYRDPTGKPLAPKLPPAPINGPNVKFRHVQEAAAAKMAAPGGAGYAAVEDRLGRRWALNNQGRVHQLMSAHGMCKIEEVFASVFEGILGERVTTQPVQVVDPFPGRKGGLRPKATLEIRN